MSKWCFYEVSQRVRGEVTKTKRRCSFNRIKERGLEEKEVSAPTTKEGRNQEEENETVHGCLKEEVGHQYSRWRKCV